MRFIRTKNNRAPDGEDRYAVRSTCFLAEDRNTIVLQEDSFMSMEAALQIRIDSAVNEQVEALYRSLGTSFAEAVRMFVQQSLQKGGMPFRPSLRAWDDMSEAEISEKLSRSSEDTALAERWDNAFALCYRRIWLHFRLSIRYMT